MARGCLQGVKYLMFAFNLLFWLGGCGILGVGIWLAATQGNFATLSSSFPSLSAANLLIATGTLVMAIGFVGCIGAIKENRCLLLTFFAVLLLVFLLEATVAVLFFTYTDKIDRYAQRDLKKGLHLYGTPGNVGLTNAWSIIQTDFRCCGVSNYTDWFEVYNATRVPDSCCLGWGPEGPGSLTPQHPPGGASPRAAGRVGGAGRPLVLVLVLKAGLQPRHPHSTAAPRGGPGLRGALIKRVGSSPPPVSLTALPPAGHTRAALCGRGFSTH